MIDRNTVFRLAREAANNGGSTRELWGDAIERFAQLVFLEAASTRGPLTDDEVASLLDAHGIACDDPGTAFAIAEIVERAHGIGVKSGFGDDDPRVVAVPPDYTPLFQCNSCGRKSRAEAERGRFCDMPKPGNRVCSGIMQPYSVHAPFDLAGEIAYQLTKRMVIDISTARAAVDEALRSAGAHPAAADLDSLWVQAQRETGADGKWALSPALRRFAELVVAPGVDSVDGRKTNG